MKHNKLINAKKIKNDEFYTQLTDISKELSHYKEHFKDKTVYCNCDDPTWSAFWEYFHLNFSALGLKKLISTHYDKNEPSYKMEYTGGDDNNIKTGTISSLKDNGDFRNQECLELLGEADIVVTNPPFSLFRDFVATLEKYQLKYLIIGNLNAITYKEIFSLIKDGKLFLGHNTITKYRQPDGTLFDVFTYWYTNFNVSKCREPLILSKKYDPTLYPTYDNYNAINVDKVKDIPCDYYGVMGVPITFLYKYNPNQFEIVSFRKGNDGKDLTFTKECKRVQPYFRILVQPRLHK